MKILPAIAVSSLLVVSAVAQAGPMVPNKTLSLKFVGFCDGMSLSINHGTGGVTGRRIGCGTSEQVRGYVGAIAGGNHDGQGVVVGFDSGTGFLYVISDSPQTWENYNLATGTRVNTGTWTVGVPAIGEASGAPASND